MEQRVIRGQAEGRDLLGRFSLKGASTKCLSMACAPPRNSVNFSHPMARAIEVPMADHEEYRPPTLHNSKWLRTPPL